MVGKHVERHPHVVEKVRELGHLVGNHTFDHPDLVKVHEAGEDAVAQIARTDSLISDWVDGPITFVRPPYLSWSRELAGKLNDDRGVSRGHCGPIGCDIYGSDWRFWQRGQSAEACADHYVKLVESAKRGIILLHDSTADNEEVRLANMASTMTQLLVPRLLERGYLFLRLDQLPEVVSATNSSKPK